MAIRTRPSRPILAFLLLLIAAALSGSVAFAATSGLLSDGEQGGVPAAECPASTVLDGTEFEVDRFYPHCPSIEELEALLDRIAIMPAEQLSNACGDIAQRGDSHQLCGGFLDSAMEGGVAP